MSEYGQAATYPSRSLDPLDLDNLTLTVMEIPSDFHDIVGSYATRERQEIVVDPDFLIRTGKKRRSHIRLQSTTTGLYSLYTIAQTAKMPTPTTIYMTATGPNCIGLSGSDLPFTVTTTSSTIRNDITHEYAQANGETYEQLIDSSSVGNRNVISIAWHGGDFERPCPEMAQEFLDTVLLSGSVGATCWHAWSYGDSESIVPANYKWHITAVDVYPPDWPLLNTIADRKYDYSISFHGQAGTAEIDVGGLQSNAEKANVVSFLQGVVSPNITVEIVDEEAIFGASQRNILNRLTSNYGVSASIQLEMTFDVRAASSSLIAQAMAHYYKNNYL